jgi:hypothetical protein
MATLTAENFMVITDYAAEFLAEKHGITAEQVMDAVLGGNQRAIEQVLTLVRTGLAVVDQM